ncbi:MAG TPA: TOBE domain-containing protein [Burkholderiaceae bacterium]
MPDDTLVSADLRLAGRLDARFFALLEAIAATGSINRAARTAGLSYRGAWLILDNAANLARSPLVESAIGGSGGGGTRLTDMARELMAAWRDLQSRHHAFLREQEAWLLQRPALAGALRRMAMKTSARNQFAGTIVDLARGPVSTEATLELAGGQRITAAVTTQAAERMGLAAGQEAIALIKASAIVLVADFAGYVLSARNQLAGTVSRIERGAVSSLVALTLPGGTVVTASVTNDAVDALDLAVGHAASAVFKAYSVLLAVAAK